MQGAASGGMNRTETLGSFEHIPTDDPEDEGDGYEGLENVRACCDGAHDIGSELLFLPCIVIDV